MDDDCGHHVVPGPDGPEHHEIPDDDAPHAASPECGCGPQLVRAGAHPVYVHADQDRDPEDPYDWDTLFTT